MHLNLDVDLIKDYKNQSQVARVLTEHWVQQNSFCPNCGNDYLSSFDNNKPVADFFCKICNQEYELKSKAGILSNKIVDGAYSKMISRIKADNNPNFFFMTYNKTDWKVKDFLIIPKHYFVADLIEERKPLAITAKRAGWIGCNILLNRVPSSGRIFLIKEALTVRKDIVLEQWQQTCFLKDVSQKSRGWLIDIMACLDLIPNGSFILDDVYKFEKTLKAKYPNNNFIKDKIRQQLQILRDKGIIKFIGKGTYRK